MLIVITVLGVLAGIVVFAVGGITARSAVAACQADATTVETAVKAYEVQTGGSPTVTPSLLTNSASPYLQSFPSSTYFNISIDGAGNVLVAAPIGATPVVFGTPNACDGAGNSASPNSSTSTTFNAVTTTTSPTTTSTTTSTTTTTSPSNGVTVVPSSNDSNDVSGSESLSISNVDSITSLMVTIQVSETSGLRESTMTNTFPVALRQNRRTSRGIVSYSWTLKNLAVPANRSNDAVTAFWTLRGTPHLVSGDTWSVTSTSNGKAITVNGNF